MCLLLNLYLEISYLTISILIGIGLLSGILTKSFTGYILPNKMLFKYRFIAYGIGFGIMIGFIVYIMHKSLNHQDFNSIYFIKLLIISIPIGLIFNSAPNFIKFKKLRKKTNVNIENKDSISDYAIYINSENKIIRGLLLLSNNSLSFYSGINGESIFEIALKDVNPTIKKSKVLNIPNGLSLQNNKNNVNIAFPKYWIKLIESRNKHKTI